MPEETHRQRIENEVNIDLNQKSDEHLLADVHDESKNALREHAPTTRTLARFASLLVVLSRRAKKGSKRLEDYTVTLVRLTWALVIVAAVTFFAVGVQIYLIFYPPK